ncbi:hypothetical protein SELMODRAFT_418541 [Selaginella moellendorffii]|uniref:WRC domain-containing protein n=1 Tax=Selaginella moellendorffii TaxID=88036 RepID=D8S615_SELML|nr:uncharacterized protein LOC9658656 isoform X2 [Selaginella moellendorffii]EFJ20153.1 hypothetical protein SELMODRAFT_418541 [Selaginella moellendorffii]|eukprot:XP_002978706.1 uncharacterized protein LOC9658656 isoform X2 [Selaginella moellendorffii]
MRIRKHLSAVHLPAVANPILRSKITAAAKPAAAAAPVVTAALAPGNFPGCKDEKEEEEQGEKSLPGNRGVVPARAPALVGLVAVEEEVGDKVAAAAAVAAVEGKGRGLVAEVCSSIRTSSKNQDEAAAMVLLQSSSLQQFPDLSLPMTPAVSLPTRPKRTKPRSCSAASPSFVCPPPPPPPPRPGLEQQQLQLAPEMACMQQQQQQLLRDHGGGELDDDDSSPKSVKVTSDLIDVSSPPREAPPLQQEAAAAAAVAGDTDTVVVSGALIEQRRSTRRPRSRSASLRNLQELEDDGEANEGSQCRRMDGKGWRCHRTTQPDYSLCDYHLDKFRETNQRKLRNAATAQEATRRRSRVKRKPVKARSLMSI